MLRADILAEGVSGVPPLMAGIPVTQTHKIGHNKWNEPKYKQTSHKTGYSKWKIEIWKLSLHHQYENHIQYKTIVAIKGEPDR